MAMDEIEAKNYADLKQTAIDNAKLIEAQKVLIEKLSKPEGPRHIEVSGNDGHLVMDPALIDRGDVVVTLKEPELATLKDGEISAHDQAALNKNIEAIASGKVTVR